MDKNEWIIELKEFPGYFISSLCDVYSDKFGEMKKLKKSNSNGYLQVSLMKNGKCISKLVHQLLAKTFIPNPNNFPVIDHINQNKKDNRLKNLRWTTYRINNINKKFSINTKSKIIGIKITKYNKYKAHIRTGTKRISKNFDTLEEAIKQRNIWVNKYHIV